MKQRKLIRWMVFSFLLIITMAMCTCTDIVPGVVKTARADDGDSVSRVTCLRRQIIPLAVTLRKQTAAEHST